MRYAIFGNSGPSLFPHILHPSAAAVGVRDELLVQLRAVDCGVADVVEDALQRPPDKVRARAVRDARALEVVDEHVKAVL